MFNAELEANFQISHLLVRTAAGMRVLLEDVASCRCRRVSCSLRSFRVCHLFVAEKRTATMATNLDEPDYSSAERRRSEPRLKVTTRSVQIRLAC